MTDLNSPNLPQSGAPLVSVIIPFLNAAKYLRESIESVLAQSYGNWELLLIDDGSCDSSADIGREFQQRYPEQILVFEHPGRLNRGISASRNLAIANSKGPVVAFLDGDDVFHTNALAKQVNALISHPEAGAIIPQLLYWRSWQAGSPSETSDFVTNFQLPLNTVLQPPTLLLRLYPLGPAPAPAPTGIFVRRQVLEEIGGFEESFHGKAGLYEDQAFLCKLYLSTPISVSAECVARYRLHSDSDSAARIANGDYDTARLAFLHWFSEYLRRRNISNPEIVALIEKAMWPYRNPALHAIVSFPKKSLQAAKSLAKNFLRR